MRPCRSDGALRRQILEPVTKRSPAAVSREPLESSKVRQVPAVPAVPALEQMQKQLHKAEAMLNSCVRSVEAAWDLSAQRLTEFDQKLSALDVRLVELKQIDEVPKQTDTRLVTLENRIEELMKRLDGRDSPTQPLPLEGLDFLNHRVASLSERLAAEARVREAQFRRLESMLSQWTESHESQHQPLGVASGISGTSTAVNTVNTTGITTLTHNSSMPTLPGARSSFLEVVADDLRSSNESEKRYRDARVTELQCARMIQKDPIMILILIIYISSYAITSWYAIYAPQEIL